MHKETIETVITTLIEPGTLVDRELELMIVEKFAGNSGWSLAPAYRFKMTNTYDGRELGRIELRIGNSTDLRMYSGHIGYRVHKAHRGHRYAARAVRLLVPLARHHQLGTLWITCNPDNYASRRSCELAGLELAEIVDLPPTSDMYRRGERQKCRYRLRL
ncbi:MAG: GNAT family N-acetyltransferase [Caldilineaceae bacterium]|nr:GNAT family N-acetyltransferase [Caldilineaceae bacterium]MCB0106472.1 GNAT family N-acetyltransferase [Caldilineaceae bacterium]HRW05131.1 GNAT family N-acetyltransferase [Caldilineaceae bacterium]